MATPHRYALPAGYQLLWYRIGRVLGQGNFGITYLATDTNLDRQVAVKEYLPVEWVVRDDNNAVQEVGEHTDLYRWGLTRFIAEARTLAKFNHRNIVRVHSVFESNNTAYIAMEYEQGNSLDVLVRRHKLDGEGPWRRITSALLDALEYIHDAGYIHRDLKPANIFVRMDGSPVLLDFGSTRMALGTQAGTLTTLVTRGYAPCEQYDSEYGKQGPWTDIYALGATLYVGIAGAPPIDALLRVNAKLTGKSDPLKPAVEIGKGAYSPQFLHAVDAALKMLPGERPANIAAWRKMFTSPRKPPKRVAVTPGARSPTAVHGRHRRPPLGGARKAHSQSSVHARRRAQSRSARTPRRRIELTLLVAAVAIGLGWAGHRFILQAGKVEEQSAVDESAPPQASSPDTNELEEPTAPSETPSPTNNQDIGNTTSLSDVASFDIGEKDRVSAPTEGANPPTGRIFRDTLADGSLGPEMVILPAGSFQMGDTQGQGSVRERPVHTVHFDKPFAIGRYEVTFEDYDRFARATGRSLPSDRGWGRADRPVINVAWKDALAYANWLSQQTAKRYRLPTEAEWEYAARAGTETAYWWGNDIGSNRANCDGCGSQWDRQKTAPVGSFEPNAFDLYDTAGNVWEWVQDCKSSSYRGAPTDGSEWLRQDCAERLFRGGAWNVGPHKVRATQRTWDGPVLRYSYVGFRLARD